MIAQQLSRISQVQMVANVVTGAALILALSVAVISLVLVRRQVDQPLSRLLSEVETVAGGDYDHPISTSGPEEVAVLADAVASMRASIVHSSDALIQARQDLALTQERDRLGGRSARHDDPAGVDSGTDADLHRRAPT